MRTSASSRGRKGVASDIRDDKGPRVPRLGPSMLVGPRVPRLLTQHAGGPLAPRLPRLGHSIAVGPRVPKALGPRQGCTIPGGRYYIQRPTHSNLGQYVHAANTN